MTQTDIIQDLRSHIREIAKRLEKQRKSYLTWLLVGIGIVSFFMTFLLLFINPQGIDLRYTVTFGALLPSAVIYLFLGKLYLDKGKRNLVNALCRASGLQHREDGCFAVSAAGKHKILPPHNRSKLETGLQGVHKGTAFAIQEVILTELRQDKEHKKRKKEYLRFWGLLVRIQLSGRVYGHTVVMPPLVRKVFFSRDFGTYTKVKTNDSRFEQAYEVITSDKVDAKVIVSTSFRDQFGKSAKDLKSFWSEASFQENEVFFAFQRFQPLVAITPLWKPVTEQTLRKNVDEIAAVLKLIDVLRANAQLNK